MESEQKIRAEIKKLLGAVAHSNFPEAMKAHKVLYKTDSSAIPYIEESLFKLDFSKGALRHSKAGMLYVTSLVNLIHDIDEDESRKVTRKLIQQGCNTTIAQRLETINSFTLDDYFQYEIKGVSIFEYKKIKSKYEIRPNLEKWFGNVPDDDLKEIERIYIVDQTKEQDYAGYFMSIFFYIKLVWYASQEEHYPIWLKFLLWLSLINMELTFYHEVGHHVHRHTRNKKLKQEREDEADRYARRRFLSNRPTLQTFHKIFWGAFDVVNLFRPNPK